MLKRILTILLFLFLAINYNAISQDTVQSGLDELSKQDSVYFEKQIAELKFQNELLKSHNEQLVQIISWSLTFAAVFLIGFLGLIGYFTNKRFKSDKESLKDLINSRSKNLSSELDDELKSDLKSFEDRIDKRIDSLNQNLRDIATASAKNEFSSLEESVDKLSNKLKRKTNSIERELSSIKIDVYEVEAKMSELDGIKSNALSDWTFAAKKSWETDRDWRVSHCLENIHRLLSNGSSLSGDRLTNLNSLLEELPPKYSTLVDKIREKL